MLQNRRTISVQVVTLDSLLGVRGFLYISERIYLFQRRFFLQPTLEEELSSSLVLPRRQLANILPGEVSPKKLLS